MPVFSFSPTLSSWFMEMGIMQRMAKMEEALHESERIRRQLQEEIDFRQKRQLVLFYFTYITRQVLILHKKPSRF